MKMLRGLLLVLLCLVGSAHAEVRPFVSGSLDAIRAARAGHPFILTFWSIDCAHCPKELKVLGELKKRYPKLDVVLVSTDNESASAPLTTFAAQQGLGSSEQWVFADAQVEKLRYEVDRRWWGELPRTYFFDARHQMDGVSGVVAEERLRQWVKEQAPH